MAPGGMGPGRVLGFDYVAAFALADGMGVPRAAVAEFLPDIDAIATAGMNRTLQDDGFPDEDTTDG